MIYSQERSINRSYPRAFYWIHGNISRKPNLILDFRMKSEIPKDDVKLASGGDLAVNDAAELLYQHATGSIGVSVVACTFLLLISARQAALAPLLTWWGVMTGILALRMLDVRLWHKREGPRDGFREIRRFGTGVLSAATLWAAFPLIFFSDLNQTGRAASAIILCGMAGGSATVLAPSQTLALIFCAALIWPATLFFLFSSDFESRILGALGCVFFIVMAISSRLTHRTIMRAVRLSHANEKLLIAVTREQERTEAANGNLREAQVALHEANQSLEFRIRLRTSDLQREVSEKERYAKELAHLASTDPLTGLCNRARLVEHLKTSLFDAGQSSYPLAVLFIDLDKFKEVNDAMGHYAGDRVLQVAAQRLAGSVPANAHLSRWGGDEFVVVMPDLEHGAAAEHLGDALRMVLCEPIQVDLETVNLDATVGVALFPEHGRDYDELIRAADVAMYTGKEERRSKVRLFDPSLSRKLIERRLLEHALHRAIRTQGFSLVFEPIISASEGDCHAMEALLRWRHPQLGEIAPSKFIPLAERTGDIVALGRWVLREACREAMTWHSGVQPMVSVNVSTVQILSGSFVSDVFDILAETNLPASRLQLELTESVFVSDHAATTSVLAELRSSGIHVSLDDFGTGFSCLSYLRNLPLDSLKIDRSFIQAVDAESRPIVRAILTTAQAFGFKAIAEGVETPAQAAALVSLGADYLQGHLFVRGPLSPEAAREWLAARLRRPGLRSEAAVNR